MRLLWMRTLTVFLNFVYFLLDVRVRSIFLSSLLRINKFIRISRRIQCVLFSSRWLSRRLLNKIVPLLMIIKRSSQLRQSITVTHVHDIIRLIQVGISVISKLTIARGRTSSSPIK